MAARTFFARSQEVERCLAGWAPAFSAESKRGGDKGRERKRGLTGTSVRSPSPVGGEGWDS